jgi:hypothetical protein
MDFEVARIVGSEERGLPGLESSLLEEKVVFDRGFGIGHYWTPVKNELVLGL